MQNNRPRILVVDSDQSSCREVESVLSMFNYVVVGVETAAGAIELARSSKFDTMVVSIELPDGGFQLSQEIRKIEGYADIPMAFSTSHHVDQALMMESQFYGGLLLFHQPYKEVELLTQVSSMVRIKHLQDQLKEKMAELDKLASTDPLTGLYNRRLFFQRVEVELSRAVRHASPLSLVFLDIDHFKQVNDTYGHQAGDEVLIQLSKIMTRLLRASDVLGRVGGEEFMILLPDTPAEPGLDVVERLRKEVENSTFSFEDTIIPITISAGVYHIPNATDIEVDEMVKCADHAMYEAKDTGRNKVVCYDPERNTG